MPLDQRLKNLHGSSRRQFLRWATTLGAVLGLERSRFLDALSGTAGVALADTASCATTMRSIHLIGGNGGIAWFQLLWPHVEIAIPPSGVDGQNFAFHAPGQATLAQGTDRPFAYAPQSPWKSLGKTKQVSAIMTGENETHRDTPRASQDIGNNRKMIEAVAAVQTVNPTLIPILGVGNVAGGDTYPNAPQGAPTIARVNDADGLVDLFNSTASQTLLKTPENSSLSEAYYKAFLSLNGAAGNPAMSKGFGPSKTAVNLLGRNLASALRPTPEDLNRYGVGGSRRVIENMAKALITSVKAFKLGLTSSVIIPAFLDDPHGAFGDMAGTVRDVTLLGKILDSFLADCATTPDPSCQAKSLADTLVLTVHGDTPKDPRNRGGWPDGTPGNSNWMYVMGNGYLKTGWFGGVKADGSVLGFDPANPDPKAVVPNKQSITHSNATAAAVVYAVTKGDLRRVQDFYRGPLDALVVPQNL